MKSKEDNPSVLIIGYGNSLRGDDGLGCIAARHLQYGLKQMNARVLICHQLTPDLAEDLSHVELAIFVDACVDHPPGEIHCEALTLPLDATSTLDHHASPGQLLVISQALFGRRPEAYAFTMGGASWEFSESLSPIVREAMPQLIRQIEDLIALKSDSMSGAAK